MLGDIKVLRPAQFGDVGSKRFVVAASATTIKAGEPVAKALGAAAVTPLATNKPVVATDYMAGIATSTSTNTASADGVVDVMPLVPGVVYIADANTPASWNTQSEYDALVGDRVLFDLTSEKYTVLHTDGATSGLVVEPLDVAKYPGKVAFSIRNGVDYLS